MSDELSSLPLKSMELPTKTVAKLKPLALATIKDLYAVPLERFIELGLVLRELEEIAEAAADFGCSWRSKAEVKAAFAAAPPSARPVAAAPKPAKATPQKPAKGLPADFEEALAAGPDAVGLTVADLDALTPYGSLASGFQTPRPSSRHLRVFRRLRLVRAPSIGGPERAYVVAVADVTQIPRERRGDLPTLLCHFGNLIVDVFERAGVDSMSQTSGGATSFAIAAKSRVKAEKLIAAHGARFDAAPAFAMPSDGLAVIAAASLLAAGLHAEALPFASELAGAAKGLGSGTALEALRCLAIMFLEARRPADGLALLSPLLTPDALASVPRSHDTVSALCDTARLCVRANASALAVTVLARAIAVDPGEVHAAPLRGRLLDEPAFDVLHTDAAFRRLFRGFPAFEARLGLQR